MFILIFYMLMTLTLNDWQQFMICEVKDYFDKTEYKNVSVTITALSILETGWYKAPVHDEFKNAFSMKEIDVKKQHPLCKTRPIYCMKQYKTYKEGYKDLLAYFIIVPQKTPILVVGAEWVLELMLFLIFNVFSYRVFINLTYTSVVSSS